MQVNAQWTPVRVAKWSTLGASTSALIYGFTQNRSADREYASIERMCSDNPGSCARADNSDVFADAALEQRYQKVLRRDDRARTALVAGQLGLLASLALFIIDLPGSATPKTVPYNPKAVRFRFGFHELNEGIDYSRVELRATLSTNFLQR